jgi:hypothetical protein
MIWGGISYIDFDTKLRHKSQFCFRDKWDILNFVPANYFFIKTHWAEGFFYKTLVCFQGVTKPSFSYGFTTCFLIEFLFTKINSNRKNDSLDLDTQGASASKSLLTIPKINFLTETCGFKVGNHHFLMVQVSDWTSTLAQLNCTALLCWMLAHTYNT